MNKVRYAVVGAGWISQEAFMPGVGQTGNSEIAAIVSGNADTSRRLAEFHRVPEVVGYEDYDTLLASGRVDAVYIALPNSMHADYAIRALRRGIHALVEKPLALTVAECEAMIVAAREGGAFLMTAYRLHSEPGTMEVLERVRRGEIGTPRLFHADFSFQSGPDNHRLRAEHWGGPLQDIGVYCLNAARQIFGAEPLKCVAMEGAAAGDARFQDVHEGLTAILRFPNGALASFSCSFGAAEQDRYRITGSDGIIDVERGFRFETVPKVRMIHAGGNEEWQPEPVDHFGAQTAYFSDCIRQGTPPEADGAEGLADVRALRAIEEAARTGRAVTIGGPERDRRPGPDTVRRISRTDRRLVL
ncbi:Gfo/Idh/MocA family protein [Rubellimicrobium aerolatum]|uniref:Gfo/Idh/MocA family protein n=1 Tax=Rubellimicrobium aerolatum TaxID=490979 RepID=A0ABW0SCV8_9RHOB|nr:Gfo/Idh/MocA family oxidoreductase [Rubellimicrobium aerolatum]MBP1806666.1 putative dehydrogenase [Rubellimicrobium aerolatum]